jgi:DNA-binding CsgD family transcriptional regulator
MFIRFDQVQQMLAVVAEAREIGAGTAQKEHLVAGIHRLLGAAMTTFCVIKDVDDPRKRRLELEVSTPPDRQVRAMIDALRTSDYVSSSLAEIHRRFRSQSMVTARRRELLSDGEWYRSESFNLLHRVCGFDDHVYSLRLLPGARVSGLALRRAAGERPYAEEDRCLLELFHEQVARLQPAREAFSPHLSPREREVLQRLLRGASEKAVASEMGLSQHTVHSYAKSIYAAYGVSSRPELLARCLGGRAAVSP